MIAEMKKIIKDSLFIILISAALAMAVNYFHPSGFSLISKRDAAGKIAFISGIEAKIKFDRKSAVFIDSRDGTEFINRHIEGAINIPVSPESISNKKIKEHLGLLKEPVELLIYCNGESCGTSRDLAKKLFSIGYSRHIYILKKGFPEWESLGYPVKNRDGLK